MNLKAPLPGEEYGVTIEDLQAEVLNKPVRQENVAFKFGRSDSKKRRTKRKVKLKVSRKFERIVTACSNNKKHLNRLNN